MSWEHSHVTCRDRHIESVLEAASKNGWELVSATQQQDVFTLFFKRRVPVAQTPETP